MYVYKYAVFKRFLTIFSLGALDAWVSPNTIQQQQQQQALFTFRFRIIIVTEGSNSLTVSYMQCNKRKTKNTLQERKFLA